MIPDTELNRCKLQCAPQVQVLSGGLATEVLGFESSQLGVATEGPTIVTASGAAKVDRTRAVVFHAPTLAGDDSAQGKKALEVYEKVRDQYNSEYSDHVRAHKKTPSQEKNWIEWPEYLEIVHKLGDAVSHLKGGSSQWSEEDMMNYQDYILTLFYSKYPLRNDLFTKYTRYLGCIIGSGSLCNDATREPRAFC